MIILLGFIGGLSIVRFVVLVDCEFLVFLIVLCKVYFLFVMRLMNWVEGVENVGGLSVIVSFCGLKI